MSTPKRHHYVPKMLLNGFADPDGWLWWCRHREDPGLVRRGRPAELFHRRHLYSIVAANGAKDPKIEGMLSRLEGEACHVVEAIIASARRGEVPQLTAEQKRLWYLFFLMQWRRAPEAQMATTSDEEGIEMLDEILDELRAARPDRQTEIDALATPAAKARTLRNVRVQALLGFSANVMGVLEQRGMAVIRNPDPRKQFVVGSRPVVKLTSPGCTDLRDPRVEMWLAIAPDVLVGAGRGDAGICLVPSVADNFVRHFNLVIAQQSEMIAAGSEALVRSIASPR